MAINKIEINNLPQQAHQSYAQAEENRRKLPPILSDRFLPGTQHASTLTKSHLESLDFFCRSRRPWVDFTPPQGSANSANVFSPLSWKELRTSANAKLHLFIHQNGSPITNIAKPVLALLSLLEKQEALLIYCESRIKGIQKS